jgi:hypothetical protein
MTINQPFFVDLSERFVDAFCEPSMLFLFPTHPDRDSQEVFMKKLNYEDRSNSQPNNYHEVEEVEVGAVEPVKKPKQKAEAVEPNPYKGVRVETAIPDSESLSEKK